jgi:hypothetical protein
MSTLVVEYAAAVLKIKKLMGDCDNHNFSQYIDSTASTLDKFKIFVTDPKIKMLQWEQKIKSCEEKPRNINGSLFWSFDIPATNTDMIIINTKKHTDPNVDLFLTISDTFETDQCNCVFKPLMPYYPLRIFMKEKESCPESPVLTFFAVMFNNELRKNIILNK